MTARLTRLISRRGLKGADDVRIEATPQERAAIAEAMELASVDSLEAELTVRPWRGDGVRVDGTVRGAVVQPCVVTLEPVTCRIEETIDVRLHPDSQVGRAVNVDPDGPDPAERLEGDKVDLGAIALEHFALGIDPYPRAPGAAFDADIEGVAAEKEPSPFAALEKLKGTLN